MHLLSEGLKRLRRGGGGGGDVVFMSEMNAYKNAMKHTPQATDEKNKKTNGGCFLSIQKRIE